MKLSVRALLLCAFVTASVWGQTGTRLIDFNAKSIGRGGTSIGYFDGTELMMTNPAGISFLDHSMLDADFSLMMPSLHFKNNLNDADGESNVFPLPSAAYVQKYKNSNFSWGIGFFTAGGMGADFNLRHALYREQDGSYTLQKYHSKLAVMQGGLTAAYKLTDNLSVGASLHLVYSMLEFGMPFSLNPAIMGGTAMPGMTFGQMFAAPASMGGFGYSEVTAAANMSDLNAVGFNGKIGLAYKVNDKLSMGLSYTMPSTMTYKNGKATMDMTYQLNDAFGKAVQGAMAQGMTLAQAQAYVMGMFTQLGIDMTKGVQASYDLEAELKLPQSIGFGIAYKVSDILNISADAEYIMWENAFDKMAITLTNGSNANVNKMIGNSSFSLNFPMNWKNSLNLKFGLELMASNALTLRAGYAYNENPVPSSTVFPVFPAIVENHIMFGASYKVSAPLTIHAAFETALNNTQTADSRSIVASEYNGSTSQLSTVLLHVAVSYCF